MTSFVDEYCVIKKKIMIDAITSSIAILNHQDPWRF
jgi:hypothetical protein